MVTLFGKNPSLQAGETSVLSAGFDTVYHESTSRFEPLTAMTEYSKGSHTIFHHRYHWVWITQYRYRVLQGDLRLRVRMIIAQVAEAMSVRMVNGVLSADHVPIVAEIPPHVAVSDFVKIAKGRSSRKIQQEFSEIGKRYWGRHFWGRGFFSTTSGNVTDEMINAYIHGHVDAHKSDHETNITLEGGTLFRVLRGFQPRFQPTGFQPVVIEFLV